MIPGFCKTVKAKPHSHVYMMHKYFARRPWNLFSELIAHYSSPGEIVLDPFCGGGVTVVESLKLKRRAIGVDVNPLAAFVTLMETEPIDCSILKEAFHNLGARVKNEISMLYSTKCLRCSSNAVASWVEWDEKRGKIVRIKYHCPTCSVSLEKLPENGDVELAKRINDDFDELVSSKRLWFPQARIPPGDKTNSLLNHGIDFFHQLFTRRNLLALSILFNEINLVDDCEVRDLLLFAFSGSLKWASKQSHLRGEIVEGWALHAYWIYQKSLEINVWKIFERRVAAVGRGKAYINEHIGSYCKQGGVFNEVAEGASTCLVLNRSSSKLPLPNESIDCIVTDPPYGGNVNYGELSDYWIVWLKRGMIIDKVGEAIINRSQGKTLKEYESLLYAVFRECHRVLKSHRCLVSTFNSKDVRVVSSFIMAASRAGFVLHPEGILYQRPIRAYMTTFHAMQVGAFVGDFVFTLIKGDGDPSKLKQPALDQERLQSELEALIVEAVRGRITEPLLREKVYKILIPFLAEYAPFDRAACQAAVGFFEDEMRKRDSYFGEMRRKTIGARRRRFLDRRRKTNRPLMS